jgi:hypothetical protein
VTYPTVVLTMSAICVSCGTAGLVADYLTTDSNDFAIPYLLCIAIGLLGIMVAM